MIENSLRPFSFLLLSGGLGSRSGNVQPKQFYELAGHPIVAHTIIAIRQIDAIAEIVVNAPPQFKDRTYNLMSSYCGRKPFKVIPAGKTRQESVHLLAQNAVYDDVILHEAARPFATSKMFEELIAHPEQNVGYFTEIPFSMCRISRKRMVVKKGVSRAKVFNIQLPQKFEKSTLVNAHDAAVRANAKYTEDAVLVSEQAKVAVHTMTGNSRNLKVTNPEDFAIAEQIFRKDKT
jgi:2-C-methyl-D-erythritol 4-phosphate cytidylyltransferase